MPGEVFSVNQKVEVKRSQASWYSASIVSMAQNSVRVTYDGLCGNTEGIECLDLSSAFSHLRPFPPPARPLDCRHPTYGLCVDVNLGKCWYEGVILDRAEGFEERIALLFDLDCGIRIQTSSIRIAQIWHSSTGSWEERGMWSLIGSYKVSDDLVERISRFENAARQVIGPMVVDGDCEMDVSSRAEMCEDSSSNTVPVVSKKRQYWKPVVPSLVPGPKCNPMAIDEYVSLGPTKASETLLLATRQHLLFLGWKIDCTVFKPRPSCFRFRYTSPDRKKTHFSLRLLCQDISTSILPSCSPSLEELNQKTWRRKPDVEEQTLVLLSNGKQSKRSKIARGIHSTEKTEDTENDGGSSSECSKEVSRTQIASQTTLKRNPRTVLAWLIDNNVVKHHDEVHYRPNKLQTRLTTGKLTREGIICDCCEGLFTLTSFEDHAGSTNHRPAANILLTDGRSLMDCQNQVVPRVKNKVLKTRTKNDRNDDVCSLCQCGGDLLLCDGCPSAFHQSCLGLGELPPGDWFCFSCSCYVCGRVSLEPGCPQCERKYHLTCLESSPGHSFCSDSCRDIHTGLQNLQNAIEIGDGSLTWTLLKSSKSNKRNLTKLDSAIELMHEAFDPVKDAYTSRDIVESIIYGRESRLKRMNCQGFYTVLLEKDGVLVSAATLRVLGEKFAELPLVATRFSYRRLGMCRFLMGELEKQLSRLGVERLLLPAAAITLDTWINQFGFSVLNDRSPYSGFIILDFHGTVLCEKILTK